MRAKQCRLKFESVELKNWLQVLNKRKMKQIKYYLKKLENK